MRAAREFRSEAGRARPKHLKIERLEGRAGGRVGL